MAAGLHKTAIKVQLPLGRRTEGTRVSLLVVQRCETGVRTHIESVVHAVVILSLDLLAGGVGLLREHEDAASAVVAALPVGGGTVVVLGGVALAQMLGVQELQVVRYLGVELSPEHVLITPTMIEDIPRLTVLIRAGSGGSLFHRRI